MKTRLEPTIGISVGQLDGGEIWRHTFGRVKDRDVYMRIPFADGRPDNKCQSVNLRTGTIVSMETFCDGIEVLAAQSVDPDGTIVFAAENTK